VVDSTSWFSSTSSTTSAERSRTTTVRIEQPLRQAFNSELQATSLEDRTSRIQLADPHTCRGRWRAGRESQAPAGLKTETRETDPVNPGRGVPQEHPDPR
jgi:hypothetical protein